MSGDDTVVNTSDKKSTLDEIEKTKKEIEELKELKRRADILGAVAPKNKHSTKKKSTVKSVDENASTSDITDGDSIATAEDSHSPTHKNTKNSTISVSHLDADATVAAKTVKTAGSFKSKTVTKRTAKRSTTAKINTKKRTTKKLTKKPTVKRKQGAASADVDTTATDATLETAAAAATTTKSKPVSMSERKVKSSVKTATKTTRSTKTTADIDKVDTADLKQLQQTSEDKSVKTRKTKKETKALELTLEEKLESELTEDEIEKFQIEKVNMEQLIRKVCDILSERESAGMLQNELWKKLKLSDMTGSRLALKLERIGTITREKLLEKDRWTYKLILKKTPISTQSIEDAPCLTCPVEQKCNLDGEISPRTCQYIEDWVTIIKKRSRSK